MRYRKTLCAAAAVLLAASSLAQEPIPPGYPPADYPPPEQMARPPSFKQNLRQLFAGTLATVVQGLGAVVAGGITHSVNGALAGWFAKQGVNPPPPQPYPPGQPYPPEQYPQAAMSPQQAYSPPPPAQPFDQPPPPAQPFDQPPPADAQQYVGFPPAAPPAAMPPEPMLYAGLAYEVHLLGPSGPTPVDPATHVFATGERFVVHYRPTLPGEVEVYNINPLGVERQIDRVAVAAGQLVTLGAYEFRDQTGDEVLRLVLLPCSSPALASVTRDIVRVGEPPTGPGLNLAPCGTVTRALRPEPRDIARVELDGQTAFALDPVAAEELATGSLAPRELRLTFRHY